MDNIYVNKLNMNIIKSVTLNNNVVTVTTNSNVVRTYTLKSNQIALNYYNELTYVN